MEIAFRTELHRPATTVLTIIAGSLLLVGIITISRRARERPKIEQRLAQTREMAADGDRGLWEVVPLIARPNLITAVEAQGGEPGGDVRLEAVTYQRDVANKQETERGAQDQTGRPMTDLAQANQHTSLSWFELSQKHWQRNLEGLDKLAQSQSLQEFTAIRSELVREGFQQIADDSRAMLETSMRIAGQAGKAFSGSAQFSWSDADSTTQNSAP